LAGGGGVPRTYAQGVHSDHGGFNVSARLINIKDEKLIETWLDPFARLPTCIDFQSP
jgi:hypothetical protein